MGASRKGRSERRTLTMAENGIHRSGYVDVKQPAKMKGRKLKSWKKRWVVLHQMSDMAAGTFAAKVDVYADEKSSIKSPSDKYTIILEKVVEIRTAKSKTHSFAFEIVESDPVLLMAGSSEMESQTWIWSLRKIFWPEEDHEKHTDMFVVTLVQNEHTERLSLSGQYQMLVTPDNIAIKSGTHNSYEWSLSTLRRFYVVNKDEGHSDVLVIESGPKSECGDALFKFKSDNNAEILAAIKKNIFFAISQKKAESTGKHHSHLQRRRTISEESGRNRTDSTNSIEQRYRELLESPSQNRDRSGVKVSFSGSESSHQSLHSDCDTHLPPKIRTLEKRRSDGDIFGVALLTPAATREKAEEINNHSVPRSPKSETDAVDLLTRQEDHVEDNDMSDYSRVHLRQNSAPAKPPSNIISTFTVADPGYQTQVLLDEHGYSHFSVGTTSTSNPEDKTRSLSNISSTSSVSMRSASVGSRDSGILYQAGESGEKVSERGTAFHRSTNSFDSAVSTSSTVEQTSESSTIQANTKLHVEIQEIETSIPDAIPQTTPVQDCPPADTGIYQDLSLADDKEEEVTSANSSASGRPRLMKSNSTGNFQKQENPYEELDKYRKGKKDLNKLLGIDPCVDPSSVPPALPERPTSQKVKRKTFAASDRKLFTLPFSKGRSKKKERALSQSSGSDTDSTCEQKKGDDILKVKEWPLGNMSMSGNNELYQPIAIERLLMDSEAASEGHVMRERSCSLNIDMKSNLKRHSIAFSSDPVSDTQRGKTRKSKHNRNASLNVEIRKGIDATNDDAFLSEFRKPQGTVAKAKKHSTQSPTHTVVVHDLVEYHDDEPIYAEVQPILDSIDALTASAKAEQIEEPFPDLETWKPPDVTNFSINYVEEEQATAETSAVSMDLLNTACSETAADSDGNRSSSEEKVEAADVFNQGFHGDADTSTALLIDLESFDSTPADSAQTSHLFDLLNLGLGTSIQPLKADSAGTVETSILDKTTPDFVDIFHLGVGNISYSQTGAVNFDRVETKPDFESSNWADFSQFEPTNSTQFDSTTDPVYMDMSTICQPEAESIYIMPSQVRK